MSLVDLKWQLRFSLGENTNSFYPHSADVIQIIDIFEKFQPGKFYTPNFSG